MSSLLSTFLRRLTCRALPVVGAALLAACGGSTRVEDFAPTQIVTFGDELSLVQPDGKKWSVNGFDSTSLADCEVLPVWTQTLATSFGFAYSGLVAGCLPSNVAVANGVMSAAANVRVAGVAQQVSDYLAAGKTFTPTTLVTIQGGMHDVLDLYAALLAGTTDRASALAAALAAAQVQGAALAAQVNAITKGGAGGRVIYATVPALGLSPKAIKDQTAGACTALGQSCVTLLTDLTAAFNEALRVNVTNDGRYAGVLQTDEYLLTMVNVAQANLSSNIYGLSNVTEAACLSTAALPACDTTTLVSGAAGSGTKYLWADDLRPGPAWHARVATFAVARARNNPF